MDASAVDSNVLTLTLGGPPLRGRRQHGQAEPVGGHRVVRDPPEDDLDSVREGEDSLELEATRLKLRTPPGVCDLRDVA